MSDAMHVLIEECQKIADPIFEKSGEARPRYLWWGDFFPYFVYTPGGNSRKSLFEQARDDKSTYLRRDKSPSQLLGQVEAYEREVHHVGDIGWEWDRSIENVCGYVLEVIDGKHDTDEAAIDYWKGKGGESLRDHTGFAAMLGDSRSIIDSLFDPGYQDRFRSALRSDWDGMDDLEDRLEDFETSLVELRREESYEGIRVDDRNYGDGQLAARALLAAHALSALLGPDNYRAVLVGSRQRDTELVDSLYQRTAAGDGPSAPHAQLLPLRLTSSGEFVAAGPLVDLPPDTSFALARFDDRTARRMELSRSGGKYILQQARNWHGQDPLLVGAVSNYHLTIVCANEFWIVRDGRTGCSSKNGTLVISGDGSARMVPRTGLILSNGDVITLAPEKVIREDGTPQFRPRSGMASMRFEILG